MTLLDLKKALVVHAPEMASLAKSEGCLESSQALFVWSLALGLVRVQFQGPVLGAPGSPWVLEEQTQLSTLIRWIGNLGDCDGDGGDALVFQCSHP